MQQPSRCIAVLFIDGGRSCTFRPPTKLISVRRSADSLTVKASPVVMRFSSVLPALALSLVGSIRAAWNDDVAQQSGAFGPLVPAVIPIFEPQGYLHVFYDGIDVGAAQNLVPERLISQPYIGRA